MSWRKSSLVFLSVLTLSLPALAERIGEVDTVWKALGPDHKIIVEVFDDPDVKNVSCWVSRPVKGGLSGAVGLAEDPSNGSIACRQTGPITIAPKLKEKLLKETKKGGEVVFKERTSAVFKSIQVSRMYDAKRNTLVYLIWSDKVVEGSPKNSLSVVVLAPWPK